MIQRTQAKGVSFEAVVMDDLYGRNAQLRQRLDQAGIEYYGDVPANTIVYLVLGAKLGGRHLCLCVAANLTNRSGTNGQGASHDCQIGGDDAPTNPTPEPILSVIQAPSQAMFALGYADAAFDPDVPATSTAEPRLAFMTATRQRLGTRLG